MKNTNLIGRRVKVVRGTIKVMGRPSNGYHDCVIWIAGDVPIGSTGRIVDYPESSVLLQIEWDHDQKPKEGYIFGLTMIDDTLELI